jgi:hypothetical protein
VKRERISCSAKAGVTEPDKKGSQQFLKELEEQQKQRIEKAVKILN